MTRDEIIELIRTKYDPEPHDWPRHRGWDDGAGEIADAILQADAAPEVLAHAAPEMLATFATKQEARSALERTFQKGASSFRCNNS